MANANTKASSRKVVIYKGLRTAAIVQPRKVADANTQPKPPKQPAKSK